MNLLSSVESRGLRALMGLPDPVLRRLAGKPVVLDGQTLAPDLQLLLRLQRLLRKRGMEVAELEQGRRDLRDSAVLVGGDQPIGAVRQLEVAGLPARHYLPRAASGSGAGPLLLFFHGGGFVYGDLDSHDAPCRLLAERSGVPVLSVEYGVGPERAFPGAFDDAEAALGWVLAHADDLGVDPARIAVGGDSAGGQISAWVAIAAARAGIPLAWQLLFYPATHATRDTESLRLFAEDFYLTAEYIAWVTELYLPTAADRDDERMQLVSVEVPDGLAPAYVVTAGFDPLRDEGEQYARHLEAAGVAVELRRCPTQVHGFLNMAGVVRSSRADVLVAADRLGEVLGKG
ncbi:alpha/beta hydrolase [Nocardioides faecalis]|uniref:alpha/beta hydrolase n=1 Tax=Nocardioides faecalis TaxID=2803858 RepID=UPI0027DD7FCB|nr:alpha/beta hydrolase [Nocardioides faecalis]